MVPRYQNVKMVNVMTDKQDPIDKIAAHDRSEEFFCDGCGHYPIEPVHGHFVCPACKMPTKCCEGIPAE